jgi:nitrogen regulatory protein PII-like uncharacterized protein
MGEMADYYAEQEMFNEMDGLVDDYPTDLEEIHRQQEQEREGRKRMAVTKKASKQLHRFYVGANKMTGPNDWAKKTLAEAIEHAKQLCEDDGQMHVVVQIVAVVEPAARPVRVRKLR